MVPGSSLNVTRHIVYLKWDLHLQAQHWNYNSKPMYCALSYTILTGVIVFRTSMSVMSSRTMVAVCGVPPARTCNTAGLSPVRRGPLWRKAWPIIRPAMTNMSFWIKIFDVEGTRWSGWPSKSMAPHEFPKWKIKWKAYRSCLLMPLNIIGSIQNGKTLIIAKKMWNPYWCSFFFFCLGIRNIWGEKNTFQMNKLN